MHILYFMVICVGCFE